ncbi:SDR family NAD(P)-dependent oxidoreductase [Pseudonocardia oroxyli]|uniref:NAD(P)-dependent dehydrogenase, short-chain alcohol dehydrogenase family n=1 Tax=Pseudonocardia oroxyli TaxID=366584 RepID=A0A1G8D6C9_PSEOR|nr:SDR family oxidoreductase [Pseudonocardia oroxyli]SDH53325.1 NAD(P)-dependent dehydrogenase, short-chain alcohol dehydrogenase family [Pseudonocardia oroxyli]
MMIDLKGKVALITGASSGVGAATARLLAEVGAHVHCTDINEERLTAETARLREDGLDVSAEAVDVSDESAVAACTRSLVERRSRLDIVIGSHGINSVDDADIGVLSRGTYERIIEVNLGGTFNLARHTAEPLRSSGAGTFIAVASIAAFSAPAGPAYAASKGGIVSLIRAMSYQLAPDNVRCFSVSPGGVDTEMARTALRKRGLDKLPILPGTLPRTGEPEDIARVIRLLASPETSFMAGSNVTVDAGKTLH